MNADATISEPNYPFPPRFWWLKRIVPISIVLAIAYGAAMAWWRYEGKRRLDEERRSVQSASWRDGSKCAATFPIPDDLNAAVSLQRAVQALLLTQAEEDLLQPSRGVLIPARSGRAAITAALDRSRAAIDLARLSRFQKFADWGDPTNPRMQNQSKLTNVLIFAAAIEHLDGNDAAAIELLRDALNQAEVAGADGTILGHLMGSVVLTRIGKFIGEIGDTLAILPDRGATTQPAGAASRKQVEAMIAELLDDAAFRSGFARGFHRERGFLLARTEDRLLQMPDNLEAWITGETSPFAQARMSQRYLAMSRALNGVDFASAVAQLDAISDEEAHDNASDITRMAHPDLALWGKFSARLQADFDVVAGRRASAIHLAMRLYQVDHGGSLPPSLADLVPDYLRAIPADPFAGEGYPLRYALQPSPRVYSTGPSGKSTAQGAFVYPIGIPPAPATAPTTRGQ